MDTEGKPVQEVGRVLSGALGESMTNNQNVEIGGSAGSRGSEGIATQLDGNTEEQDLKYLIENSCISCDRVLPKYSVKIIPSGYVQEHDEYVRRGVVPRRLMCIDCYNSMRLSHKSRMRKSPLAKDSRSALVKELVNSFLVGR